MVLESKISTFVSKIKLGIDFFHDAGRMLVEMLDENPYIFDDIIAAANEPWVTLEVLQTFESIGRKQLAVEAMFLPKHVLNCLMPLPVDQQLAIATSKISVVTGMRQGTHKVVEKWASQLAVGEARRVIGPNGVKPVEEQAKELNLPSHREVSIGRYTVFIVNNKPFIKHSTSRAICTKVYVTSESAIEIDLVRVMPVEPTL